MPSFFARVRPKKERCERTKRIETPRCPMGQDAFVPDERVHDHDYGWALTSMEPHGRFTMVRIDRLNYRDIDVIKAPLCQDPSLEGVDKTRDWTPGIRIPSHPPLLAHFFSLCSARAERGDRSVTSFARLADALSISYYPHDGDASLTNHRVFHASGVFNHIA